MSPGGGDLAVEGGFFGAFELPVVVVPVGVPVEQHGGAVGGEVVPVVGEGFRACVSPLWPLMPRSVTPRVSRRVRRFGSSSV